MEMHQVRYFLAVARTLNFTRAAEECNVAQPSLTRAIRQLEGELGGDLFRRERPQAQLTELGQRMLPLLKQCYESAITARSLATAIKKGEIGSLRLALSRTIDPSLVTPHVVELGKLFDGLELKLLRGTASEVLEYLKQGEVELGIAAVIGDEWERLDRWPLFTEDFQLIVNSTHAFAVGSTVTLDDLRRERLMIRTYCETTDELLDLLRGREFDVARFHEVSADSDLISLLVAGLGVALVPRSTQSPTALVRLAVNDLEIKRTVHLYAVAGRQRTAVASATMKMLRAYDWSTASPNARF
jgi:DNA-binding transcriptional LysR family regulator